MKKILLSLSIVMIAATANAQPPAGDAKPGDWYGEKVTTDGAVSLNDVATKLNDGKEKVDGKITAKILDVCPKKGCWIKLAVNDSTTAFVKMKDYGFFAPVAIKGKTIVMDATASIDRKSVM